MITPFEFILIAFAAYRASRALALDSITEPFRERLEFWAGSTAWKQKVAELAACGFCNGFWLSGITYAVYVIVTTDGPVPGNPFLHLILWWAVAGAQSLLIAIDSFLLREAPPH